MKKILAISATALTFLSFAMPALAQSGGAGQGQQGPIGINITKPSGGINPQADVGTVISNALTIAFVVAALIVLFFLIFGAFQWITSGGDKEKLGKARGTIIHALVGLAILALAFLIVRVVGQILNIDITHFNVPTLDQGA